jgi:hypothetical protein
LPLAPLVAPPLSAVSAAAQRTRRSAGLRPKLVHRAGGRPSARGRNSTIYSLLYQLNFSKTLALAPPRDQRVSFLVPPAAG